MPMRRIWIVILLVIAIGCQAQHRTQAMDSDIRTLRMRYMVEALEHSGTVNRPYLVLPKSGVIDGSEAENSLEISFDEMSHDVHFYICIKFMICCREDRSIFCYKLFQFIFVFNAR